MDPVSNELEAHREVIAFLREQERTLGQEVTPSMFPTDVCRIFADHGCSPPRPGETIDDVLGGDV